jgi:putative membrane protein
VRSFGAQLVTDHTAANEKATKIANSIGVTPYRAEQETTGCLRQVVEGLGREGRPRFATAMVKDRKKDIREFEREAKKSNEPAAKFARETAPKLRKHLEMAGSLAKGKMASH